MIWLTLRQHRTELAMLIGLTAAICIILLVTGWGVHQLYDQLDIAACLGANSSSEQCTRAIGEFSSSPFNNLQSFFPWLNLIPLLVGVLVGASLLPREFEQGTYKFAWTQGVTRRHWLLVEFGTLLLVFLILAVLMTLIMTWWNGPFIALNGPFPLSSYDFMGFMPVAYATFALALGTAAGALVRRVIPTVAITFLYIPVWQVMDNIVRGYLVAPIRFYFLLTASYPEPTTQQDWIVLQGIADRQGQPIANSTADALCGHAGSGIQYEQCLSNHGFQGVVIYHPPSHFWSMQVVEAAILIVVSVLLFGIAIWRTQSRTV